MATKEKYEAVLANNTPVVAALVEVGTAAICRILGDDETSTQLDGVILKPNDVAEILAARLNQKFS